MGLSLLIKTAAGCLPPNSGGLSPVKQWRAVSRLTVVRPRSRVRSCLPSKWIGLCFRIGSRRFVWASVSEYLVCWLVRGLSWFELVCVGAVGARRSYVDYAEFVWSVSWLVRGGSCVLVFICGSLGCVRVYGLGLC